MEKYTGDGVSEDIRILIRIPLTRRGNQGIENDVEFACVSNVFFAFLTGLSKDQVTKQIDLGRKVTMDDKFLLSIFEKYSVESEQDEKYSHIPRERLLRAVRVFGLEVKDSELDSFFALHDSNKDGRFEYEEFKNVIMTPVCLPSDQEIHSAFKARSKDGFISKDVLSNALKDLKLLPKQVDFVQSYFKQGALLENDISCDEFSQAIKSTGPLPDEHEVRRVFEEHAVPGRYKHIKKEMLAGALSEAGVCMTESQMGDCLRLVKLNNDDIIKFQAFKNIVSMPNPVETWAATLPLSRILADALPKHDICDHLRVISSLTKREIDVIADRFAVTLKDVLNEHIAKLKSTFVIMDRQVLKSGLHSAASKFEIDAMEGGGLMDYHAGPEFKLGI